MSSKAASMSITFVLCLKYQVSIATVGAGVPLKFEIGLHDVASESVVVSRRDIPGKQGKMFGISIEPSNLETYVEHKLDEIQSSHLERAIMYPTALTQSSSKSLGCVRKRLSMKGSSFSVVIMECSATSGSWSLILKEMVVYHSMNDRKDS
ncbi:hypothetical protein JHK82_039753 [Glycine max]|nr:hypothetical protein JHK86_039942 [Glycine max]KAG4965549.1 hypothetical protein JHK85_040524 [Glycine max]KAG5110530.1 hypothetical protein JHK82_039753 [Glycine max]